jgi:hypothetical protein
MVVFQSRVRVRQRSDHDSSYIQLSESIVTTLGTTTFILMGFVISTNRQSHAYGDGDHGDHVAHRQNHRGLRH